MSKTLFLVGCIPVRLLLAFVAYKYSNNSYIRYLLSLITFMIGIGFFYIYATGSRPTGVETEGKPIWWNKLRPVHGTIYLLFALLNLANVKGSWVLLLVDVLIGLGAFLNNYYM